MSAAKPSREAIPTVGEFMTPEPLCLDRNDPLHKAWALMRERKLRHVVVISDERVEGILSERDLMCVERAENLARSTVKLHEALMPVVYCTGPEMPLAVVAAEMAERRVGSAVIVDHGKVAGIFTTTDALRALAHFSLRHDLGGKN